MDNEIIQKIYNELLACNKKEDLETLAGSWCKDCYNNKNTAPPAGHTISGLKGGLI